jgi:hypothetical protein
VREGDPGVCDKYLDPLPSHTLSRVLAGDDRLGSCRSLKLAAFVVLAGPPDRLTRCARHSCRSLVLAALGARNRPQDRFARPDAPLTQKKN